MKNISVTKVLVIIISVSLFFLPFFWFKPGQMDLGGDSSRLYFYNPTAYLNNYALYSVSPSNVGGENIGYMMVPFVAMLLVLKFIISSPTILIAGFHGLSFSVAFLSCYGIIQELSNINHKTKSYTYSIAALIGALLYVLSQASIQGWDKVLVTHNQVFLNPLVFFLLLKYVKTDKKIFLIMFLIISFLFSPNFSFAAAPGFFAFYPLSIAFLFIYRLTILKKNFHWKDIFISSLVFVLLEVFHIFPQIASMFSPGSVLNTAIFSNAGKIDRGLSYFTAIAPSIKVSQNIMLLPQMTNQLFGSVLFIILPVIICLGLYFNKKKIVLLTGFFFLLVLFFASANITQIGLVLYESLFYLPGFSIFRNFYGQWLDTFVFFYILFFSLNFEIILSKLKTRFQYILSVSIALLVLVTATPFLNGSLINPILWQSNGMHIFMQMDPLYEKTIAYLRSLPIEGKVLTLPLTDPGYQIVAGINGGAYQGPSTIAYLAGKKDFAGYAELGIFGDALLNAIQKHDIATINNIFSLLNISYIFHDEDTRVYDNVFPNFPYSYVKNSLPKTQEQYELFLSTLPLQKIVQIGGKYTVYSILQENYLPHIYIPQNNISADLAPEDWDLALHFYNIASTRTAFVSPNDFHTPTDISKADTIDIYRSIEKDFPPPAEYPFVRWSLNSRLYPIIIWRERHQLQTFKKNDDEYTDQLLVSGDKRIGEIQQWQSILTVQKNISSMDQLLSVWHEPTGLALLKGDHYNQWETSLSRYAQSIQEAIQTVKFSQLSTSWKIEKSIHIEEVLKYDNNTLNEIITDDASLSPDEKQYLFALIDDIYDYFNNSLGVTEYTPSVINYTLPSTITGEFTPYIQKTPQTTGAISFGDQALTKLVTNNDSLFNIYQNLNVKNNSSGILSLKVIPSIIPDTSAWQELDKNSVFAADEQFIPKQIPWDREIINGYYKEISGIKENTTYLLSFHYNTYGRNMKVGLLNENSNNDHTKLYYFPIFSETKNSRRETVFNAVVTTSNTEKLLLVIQGFDNTFSLDTISLSGISLIELPQQPNIVLKRTESSAIVEQKIPQITFTRVNPVMYRIQVHNATKPYNLILSDGFDKSWKVYMTQTQDNKKIIASYFNGDIQQTQQEDNFFASLPFSFGFQKPIASTKHFIANGYANGWTITPSDVGGKTDYTLIFFMSTQQYFYIGLMISCITFLGVVIYLIFLFISHEK